MGSGREGAEIGFVVFYFVLFFYKGDLGLEKVVVFLGGRERMIWSIFEICGIL